jgi:hypothetical protein
VFLSYGSVLTRMSVVGEKMRLFVTRLKSRRVYLSLVLLFILLGGLVIDETSLMLYELLFCI